MYTSDLQTIIYATLYELHCKVTKKTPFYCRKRPKKIKTLLHPELGTEVGSSGRIELSKLLRRACRNNHASVFTAAGSHINNMIGAFEHIEIVLDYEHSIAFIYQTV